MFTCLTTIFTTFSQPRIPFCLLVAIVTATTMTSITKDDFMVFVNSQKDMINQRTEEILLLKEERTKEIDIFIQLIDTGVKTEVTKQMKPLETKQTAMESVQNDIINRMNVFEHELSVLKENRQSKVSPLNPPPPIPLAPSNIPANATVTTLDTDDDTKIKQIVGKARRTI